jgi:transcription elongation factor Elf1
MRVKLEADVVGCKAWIRELEQTEQKYLKCLRCGHHGGVTALLMLLVCWLHQSVSR